MVAALPWARAIQPVDPYDAALTAAVDLVRLRTGANEPIFVGEFRTGHALLNPLLAYYLADRPPGVRNTMYNPGITTRAETQQRCQTISEPITSGT